MTLNIDKMFINQWKQMFAEYAQTGKLLNTVAQSHSFPYNTPSPTIDQRCYVIYSSLALVSSCRN